MLWAENVLARRYFYPGCHRMEPYRSRTDVAARPLPETDRLARRVLTLPTGTGISTADAVLISQLVRRAIAAAPLLPAALLDRRRSSP